MVVRFIIGRAGTGKTHHCLESVRSRLRDDPVDGPRLVLLVPEQAGLQMETAIIRPADIAGAHRAEVVSFKRLAHLVLDSAGAESRRVLSETARAMVLRQIVRGLSRRMRYFHRVDRLGGYVERLSATISELIQEAVAPEQLTDAAERAGGDDPAQPLKLHDLRIVYRAYLDYLGSERLDPSQYLQAARERLHTCGFLDGAELWVDGFASFSGQELLTLVALARLCRHVDITMMLDPSLCAAASGRPDASDAARLFRKTYATYRDLLVALANAGLTVEEPVLLRPRCPLRFARGSALSAIEANLFAVSGGRSAVDSTDGVEVVELPSRRVEVEYAVSRVCRWVRRGARNLRYRDIAIIVRDLSLYHDLLGAALTARGIPFFIDRRRPTAHHPLVELLRGATMLATEEMSLASVRLVLKTDLLPIDIDDADELENYLLAHGLSGPDVWRGNEWTFARRSALIQNDKELSARDAKMLARVNATRRAFLDLVDPWMASAAKGGPRDGPAWVKAITDWLDRLKVAETLERLAGEASESGDVDLAAEHRQVFSDTMSLLDDLAFAFAGKTLSIEELGETLEQGLAGLTLGLAPPMIDQVLVGSIERSRHPDIKAAVVIGCNDGVFPGRPDEDAILNDDDRALLTGGGLRLASTGRDRVLEEAMLFYVAMTRPSESLVVTCATADNDGKALRPSPYLGVLKAACDGLAVTAIGDPVRSRDMWSILSWRDLATRIAMEFRSRPGLDEDDQALRGRWNGLYERTRTALAADDILCVATSALVDQRKVRLAPEAVRRLTPDTLRASVSRLENYAACPFQYFARYVLELGEREEATLAPADVGTIHHAILEDFVTGLSARGEGFARLDDGELLGRLRESCGRVAARLPDGGLMSDARNAYMLRRSASYLARVLRFQRRVSQCGKAEPKVAELPFGFDDGKGIPALQLTTPAGRRILLRGFIDRVDLAELGDEFLGIVIDYKRTRDKRLEMDKVYHGLSLQLPAYLLALAEHGVTLAGRPIRPIGALFVSLAPKYRKVDHPALAAADDPDAGGSFKPRGLLLADEIDTFDHTSATGWSEAYAVYRKKDGSLGHLAKSDAVPRDAFDAVLDHTRTRLGTLADGILDGEFGVSPYRLRDFSPCSWCTMSSVCGFEMGISDVRFLEKLKRPDVFERLTGGSA